MYTLTDDLLVASATEVEHKEHLKLLFERLNEHCIVINPVEITFLEYTVNKDGIKPLASRVEVIREFPKFTVMRKLRKFLGMVNFYGRFIPHAAKIMSLNNLLKGSDKGNAPVKWNEIAEKAYVEMK